MDWRPDQFEALADACAHHRKPHVRVKAGAVLAVAEGAPQKQAAAQRPVCITHYRGLDPGKVSCQ